MKKKILFVVSRFVVGGAEKLVLEYAKYFSENGYTVAVASVSGGGEWEQNFRDLGVEIFTNRNGSILGLYNNFKKIKNNFQPDIVHTHLFSADFFGFFLSFFLHCKWFSTIHSQDYWAPFWKRIIWKNILPRANKVIAVSEAVADYLKNYYHLPETKIVVIKNGIYLDTWLQINADILNSEKLQLAIVGRLEPVKEQNILLQALSGLPLLDFHLQVFGDGSLRNILEDQARELKINQQISWHGNVPNLPEKLADVDAVIFPSRYEGLSLAVMEAMSAGRLVIASEAAAKELIVEGVTGRVFSAGDVPQLREIIKGILLNRERAKQLAEAGRNFAKQNFAIEKNFMYLKELYNNV
jgi:glycosyltransferase involved in cell wall biosynthesis